MLFAVLCFFGCNEKIEIDHPIAGHTYSVYFDTEAGYRISYVDFYSNGNFTNSYVEHNRYQGDSRSQFGHMLWSVEGNDITVRNDNSNWFFPELNGKVVYTGFYNPMDSTVTLNNIVYEFLK